VPPASRVATVEHVEDLSPAVRSLRLRVEGQEPFSYLPGQWISLRIPQPEGVPRWVYSIASAPRPEPVFELCVKGGLREAEGRHPGALALGTRVEFTGPDGSFVLRQPIEREAIFVGNGTGIAPLRAMLQAAARASNSNRLTLLFGARDETELLYREEWEALARSRASVRYLPTLSNPASSWRGLRGYVQEQTPSLLRCQPEADIYVCGKETMVSQVRLQCRQWAIPEDRVHFESYG
jgi:NAD(P)H-flavin reductase